MRHKDGKPGSLPDRGQKNISTMILFFVFCGLSFYLGKIFCSQTSRFYPVEVRDVTKESGSAPLKMKSISFPECSIEYQDYTPCTDPR
ncbi:hypothetical protein CRG98_031223, partial [Punica granatum]